MYKKWCEYCKILIPFTRFAIRDHENTHIHKKNKEKHLIEQNKKARKEAKASGKALETLPEYERKKNDTFKKEAIVDRETEEEKKKVNDQIAFFGEGKIWILEKEDDTLKLRFRNTITGEIKYEKPFGLMLEDYEEEAWDDYLANPPIKQETSVKIGQWEVVQQEDAFLNKYKAHSSDDEEREEYDRKEEEQQLQTAVQEKIESGDIKNQSDFTKEFLMHGEIGTNKKSIIGQKLIQLANADIELKDALPQMSFNSVQNTLNTTGLFKKKIIKKNDASI